MSVPMVTSFGFSHVVSLLDRIAGPEIVDDALHDAGLDREALAGSTVYLPMAAEAVTVEAIARGIGERHLGLRVGQLYRYEVLDIYARHVLRAPTLESALARAAEALPVINPNSRVDIRTEGEHLLVGLDTGIGTVMGARHIEEALPFLICTVMRHFLGSRWRPSWVELPGRPPARVAELEAAYRAPVRFGSAFPSVATPAGDIAAANPGAVEEDHALSLFELSELAGVRPPEDFIALVREALRLQISLGAPTAEAVAQRLGTNVRQMQRRLKAGGTRFREVQARLFEERARYLLSQPGASVAHVALILGYEETNSFRRAFRLWTGESATEFARHHRLK